ncbi:MAG: hypothetical protein M1835_006691 [Candelina submexicana]|nr:MAG: hypothetical protein M1835_006691 [Candelina submexicana]
MAVTPPPRSIIRTPPTPLHGSKYGSDHPRSTRKSGRIINQDSRLSAVTPPPRSPNRESQSALPSSPPIVKRAHLTRTSSGHFSPPPSAQTSPQKKLLNLSKSTRQRQVSGTLDFESTNAAAAALGLLHSDSSKAEAEASLPPAVSAAGMLPTPAKTPRKRSSKAVAGMDSTARILFPTQAETIEEVIASPRKNERKAKKYNGFSLDSFTNETNGDASAEKIEIFTDSKDRVPELDESENNPFYVKGGNEASGTTSSKKASKSKKAERPIARDPQVEEALKRDDGMVYVFRGKKIFRKFDDANDHKESASGSSTSVSRRPFTRSSIKPRILWPTEEQLKAREPKPVEVDEEALTDIKEFTPKSPHEEADQTLDTPETKGSRLLPPTKRTFTPASPPTSGRATRASKRKVAVDSSPLGSEPEDLTSRASKKFKPNSPFDGWQRTKPGAATTRKGRKREGEVIEKTGGTTSKRSKAGQA